MVKSITSTTTSALSVNTPKFKLYQGVVRGTELNQLISQKTTLKEAGSEITETRMAGNTTDLTLSLKTKKPNSTDSPMPSLKGFSANNNNLFQMIKKRKRAGKGIPYLNSNDSGARTFTQFKSISR